MMRPFSSIQPAFFDAVGSAAAIASTTAGFAKRFITSPFLVAMRRINPVGVSPTVIDMAVLTIRNGLFSIGPGWLFVMSARQRFRSALVNAVCLLVNFRSFQGV